MSIRSKSRVASWFGRQKLRPAAATDSHESTYTPYLAWPVTKDGEEKAPSEGDRGQAKAICNPSSETGFSSDMSYDYSGHGGSDVSWFDDCSIHSPQRNGWKDHDQEQEEDLVSSPGVYWYAEKGEKIDTTIAYQEGEVSATSESSTPRSLEIPGASHRPDGPISPDTKAAVAIAAKVETVLLCSPRVIARRPGCRRAFSGGCSNAERHLSGDRPNSRETDDEEGTEGAMNEAAAAAVSAALAWGSRVPRPIFRGDGKLPRSSSARGVAGVHGVESEIRALFRAWRASPQPNTSTAEVGASELSSKADDGNDQNAGRYSVDASDVSVPVDAALPGTAAKESEGAELALSASAPLVVVGVDCGDVGEEQGGGEGGGKWHAEPRGSETLPPSPFFSDPFSGQHSPCEEAPIVDAVREEDEPTDACMTSDRYFDSFAGLKHAPFGGSGACRRPGVEGTELLIEVFGTDDPPVGLADTSAIVGPASRIAALPPAELARLVNIERRSSEGDGGCFRSSALGEALVRVGAEQAQKSSSALETTGGEGTTPYRYRRLVGVGGCWPPDVQPAHRERWLAPAEFEAVFEMSFQAFAGLPWWKQRTLKQERRNEISAKLLRHSASAQARRHSPQPSAGELFFSPSDHRRASGSGAGSAVTSSGPEGAPRDPPATELFPDTVALIKRSVDQAAKQAFEAGRQFTQVLTYLEGCVSSLSGSKLRI